MMVDDNTSQYQTAFTVSIEAAQGVTTGVSAADRVTTIKTAIAEGAQTVGYRQPRPCVPASRPSGRRD